MSLRLCFVSVTNVLDDGCARGHWGRALARVLPADVQLTDVDREELWVREAALRAKMRGSRHEERSYKAMRWR